MAPPVWLITGASSGLGAGLALHALQAGHKVYATARDVSKAAAAYPQIENLGGEWLQLHVDRRDCAEVLSTLGNIDVLVNNAGYSVLGSIEETSDDAIHAQFETNVFGPARLINAVLPIMRQRKSGTIINVSSIAGIDPQPASGIYAASKCAIEGLSESLAKELAPFNINVLLVEPGAFRTNFLVSVPGVSEAYKGTPVETSLKLLRDYNGVQRGSVEKGVKIIFDAVTREDSITSKKYLRLPLGPDCVKRFEAKIQDMTQNLESVREISMSTDH